MNWPLPQDINEAVQNPPSAFTDPDLASGTVDVGPLGVPLPRSGGFADVYRIHGADGKDWAVKCFTRPVPGLQDRYAAIDHYLAQAALPFCVGFNYFPEGLRVRGGEFPILKMPWVEGFPLNEFVSDNLGRLNVLESLLTVWGRMCRRLRESGLAHADLQHGNVILVPGGQKSLLSVRLVDYDGMFVPALAGRPPSEYGHPSYQHPDRVAKQVYSGDLDRFPHLVVSTALRGLVVCGKGMWEKYDTGDNVLFREADYKNPAGSKLMRELWDSRDPSLVALLSHLVIACTRPIEQTAWLDLVMPEGKSPTVSPSQEREAAAILGAAVSYSVATSGASGMHRVPSGAMAVPAARLAAPVAPAMPVPARAIPVGPRGSEPQLAFGEELKAGSRGGKRRKSLAGVLVLGGVVFLAAGAGAAYHFKLIPNFGEQAVAPPSTDTAPPPPPPTDTGTPKPPDVPVAVPAPTPEVTARRVWAVIPEEFVKPVEPRHARFTADGKGVVVAGTGVPGLCLVLSTVDGRTSAKFAGHEAACIASPGPEGKAFSLGQGESKFLVWSTADGKPLPSVPLPEKTAGDYKRFSLTSDVSRALLEGTRQVRVVDLVDGKDVTPIPNATPGQVALGRDDGRMLSLIPRDKQLVVWAPDGAEELKVPITNPASTIEAWSPDGKFAVLLNFPTGNPPRQTITVVDAATGEPAKALDSGYIPGVTKFSADSSHLVTMGKNGTVELWRVNSWALVTAIPSTVAAPPTSVDLSANGMKVVITGPGNGIRLYDVGGSEVAFDPGKAKKGEVAELWRTEAADPKTQVLKFPAVSTDGKTLFAVVTPSSSQVDTGTAPLLKAYDGIFGEEKFAAKIGRPGTVPSAVTPTASGRVAVQYPSPIIGPTPILVLDSKTGEVARPTTSIERKVLDQPRAIDPDAKFYAAVYEGDTPTVGVWDLESGSQVATIAKGKQTPRFLAFGSGSSLVVGYPDRLVRFSGPTFEEVAVVNDKVSLKNGFGLGLTADGSRLVLAAQNAVAAPVFTFSTVDVKTAAHRDILRDRKVADMQILGGDRLFVSDDAGVTLTEVATGKPISATTLPGKPTRVAASLDSTILAAVEGSSLVAYRGYLDASPPSLPKTAGRFSVVWVKETGDLGRTPFRAVSVGAGGRVLAASGPRLLAFDAAGPLVSLRPTAPVEYMTTTPDGSLFTAERPDEDSAPRFRRTDPKTGKPLTEPYDLTRSPAAALSYDVTPDGRTALVFTARTLTVWSTLTGRRLWVRDPDADTGVPVSAAFLDNSKLLLASRGEKNELLVIDIDSRKVDRSIVLPDRAAGVIADVDPVGGLILIAYPEGENGASAYDLKTGKLAFPLGKVNGDVPPRFAAGGRLIVATADDKLVVFNARTGKELARDALPDPIKEFATSPDGTHVAAVFGPADSPRSRLALLKLSDAGVEDPKLVERLALPDEATVAAAMAAVKEANKAKYLVTTPAGKKTLVETLLKGANAPAAEPAPRFAMLKESLRLAVEMRDFAQMDTIGEQIGKAFAVDEYEIKAEALGRITDSFTVATTARAFADVCTDQAERAAERSNHDAAIKLLLLTGKVYRQVALTRAATAVDNHVAYLRKAKARAVAAKDALEPLRIKPDDPDANLAVGVYRCVFQGKWDEGLKNLELGSDATLRSAAAKDLAAAPDTELDIGDAWTAAAAAASPDERGAYVTRARYWYTKAASGPPMTAAKADTRLIVKSGTLELKPGLIQEGFGVSAKGVKTTAVKGSLAPVLDLNGADLDYDRGNGATVRWTGYLFPPRPGRYKLMLISTDPAQMKVDGVLVADIPRDANGRETTKEVTLLLTDKPVPLEVGWSGGSRRLQHVKLRWVPLGGAEELVPVEHLLHDKRSESLITK